MLDIWGHRGVKLEVDSAGAILDSCHICQQMPCRSHGRVAIPVMWPSLEDVALSTPMIPDVGSQKDAKYEIGRRRSEGGKESDVCGCALDWQIMDERIWTFLGLPLEVFCKP